MAGFVARNRAGIILCGALLAAWVVALMSTGSTRSSEPANRWVDGPSAFADPIVAVEDATGS